MPIARVRRRFPGPCVAGSHQGAEEAVVVAQEAAERAVVEVRGPRDAVGEETVVEEDAAERCRSR